MIRRFVLLLVPLLGFAVEPIPTGPAPADVSGLLQPILARHGVPALGGAVIRTAGLQAQGAAGVRRAGHADEPVTVDDRWHLGSCTKAMTAVLAGILIDERRLKWDQRLVESFPDLPGNVDAGRISLAQLLAHRAGLPENLPWREFSQPEIPAQRREVVRQTTQRPPLTAPGTAYQYSNTGYVCIGAMIEQAAGTSWENALRDRVWIPLGITAMGFGAAGLPHAVEQPWGHDAAGKPVDHVDNPPVMAPAGGVHASLAAWGRFLQVVLRGARGEAILCKPETWQRLLTPVGEKIQADADLRYGQGWLFTARSWGKGQVLTHAGSNTLNYAVVWLAPKADVAVIATCNSGQEVASAACDDVAAALIGWASEHP